MGGSGLFRPWSSSLPPRGATSSEALLPILTTMGALVSAYYVQQSMKSWIRRLVEIVDPLRPDEEDAQALLKPLLPIENIEAYIREKENSVIRGAEECVVWENPSSPHKTPLCVVFVHGWSACRQECVPLPEDLASELGANLYCARLPGHGRKHPRGVLGGGSPDGGPLWTEAHPRQMFLTALHALRMGLSLGEKVVFVGMSTGAALLTWLASLEFVQASESVAAMVLISPAYALGHPLYPLLKHVFATLRLWAPRRLREWLLEKILGKVKKVQALSPEHRRYTTLEYPTAAILNLLDVLWEVEALNLASVRSPLLMIGNPRDHVVDFRCRAANVFLRFGDASRKSLYAITETEHPHCVASLMLSPSALGEVSKVTITFVQQATKTLGTTNRTKTTSTTIHSPILWGQPSSSRSVPTGLGLYGRSFSSLQDLTRPFLDA